MSSASLSEEALKRACGVLRVNLQTNNDIRSSFQPHWRSEEKTSRSSSNTHGGLTSSNKFEM